MFYKNPSFIAMAIFGARLVVLGASIGDAIALSALAALYGYTLYLNSVKEIPINDTLKEELHHMRDAVNALKVARSFGR